ncbi:MAG: ATP-grasp domain-containing protein, partial [Acidimicrobiia bacterium]|nr:ATP-grasp domain-containing protein [Acidimicrobiia bacterium]
MPEINSVLIANRGEIAIRIMRSARELDIRTVAVYSDADRHAVHTRYADEAYYIGPAPAASSYLDHDSILEAARRAGVDAIHPGYGFLSENAAFARSVAAAGFTWIGPPADAIEIMGDKIEARRAAEMARANPIPGTSDPLAGPHEVHEFADRHGLPVVIKAAGGGGGRGMRVIDRAADIDGAYESAAREAHAAFSNADLYMERFLLEPRHIEAQIGRDTFGNGAFYGERDCSTQRRNQKLIEEAPAIGLPVGVREVLAERALGIAEACDYHSVGTVEFLVDGEDVYFLEMNTRLQVEHPVTELVTGIDLVAEQLRIARGEAIEPGHRPIRGHAIEFRINAEDPFDNFRPTPGTITVYREPGGPGVRVDSGFEEQSTIPDAYDNLIAKLIVFGPDRGIAIARGKRSLAEFLIRGIPTTIPAHEAILEHPTFQSGAVHTQFVETTMTFDQPVADPFTADAGGAHRPHELRTFEVELDGRHHSVEVWVPDGARGSRKPPPMPTVGTISQNNDGSITA